MKLWIDNINPAPDGYVWCKNIEEAIEKIEFAESVLDEYGCVSGDAWRVGINLINIQHNIENYNEFINWNKAKHLFPVCVHCEVI